VSGQHFDAPIVGTAAAPDGEGPWLVAPDGGIFSSDDDERFDGSDGRRRAQRANRAHHLTASRTQTGRSVTVYLPAGDTPWPQACHQGR
jgi:hypothetical protein